MNQDIGRRLRYSSVMSRGCKTTDSGGSNRLPGIRRLHCTDVFKVIEAEELGQRKRPRGDEHGIHDEHSRGSASR